MTDARGHVEGLLDLLRSREQTLGTAESCTGGLLGATITDVPGSSDVYLGGFVAYDDRVKRDVLGVSKDLIEEHGSVSASVVEEMADQTRRKLGADMAIAISGVAGPAGGSSAKPVGTVWLAVLGPADLMDIKRHVFEGDRQDIRRAAVKAALQTAVELVQEADLEHV